MKQIAGILMVLAVLTGCKSSKTVADSDVKPDNRKTAQIIGQVFENEFKPDFLSLKSSSKYTQGEESQSFKATIRMKTDSVIWISITSVGYEALRVLARQDSIFVLNRPKKEYFAGDYEQLGAMLGVSLEFDIIQSIVLGNSVGLETMEKVRRINDKDYYVLTSLNKNQLKRLTEKDKEIKAKTDIAITHWVEPETYRIAKLGVFDLQAQQSATIEYTDFETIGEAQVATEVVFETQSAKPMHLKCEFSRINVEDELRFSFKIPSKYVPVSMP